MNSLNCDATVQESLFKDRYFVSTCGIGSDDGSGIAKRFKDIALLDFSISYNFYIIVGLDKNTRARSLNQGDATVTASNEPISKAAT